MEKKNNLEKVEKKIKKDIKKENKKRSAPKKVKEIKKEVKNEEVQRNELNTPFLEDIKTIKEKKNKRFLVKFELFVIFVFSIIMLILLCNRTFFRTNYKNSKINIDIPLLMFFKEDDGNNLVMKTVRKTKYVQDYFDKKLEDMVEYNCNGYKFYYDEKNHYAIYDIDIEKNFIVKTVTIKYAAGEANCLCNANAVGKEAEKKCS